MLVYARLKGLENGTREVEDLKKHTAAARTRTLHSSRQRVRYLSLLEETFGKTSGMLHLVRSSTLLIADSAPLEDLFDMEAGWGYTSRGKFRGFKLHAVVNQLGRSLKAAVTLRPNRKLI